jgi:ribose transport system substrate-binding protein
MSCEMNLRNARRVNTDEARQAFLEGMLIMNVTKIPKVVIWLTIMVAWTFVAGCGNGSESSKPEKERPTVALIMKSLANEFFVNMANGAAQHQSQHPDQYDLIINGLKDESDLTQQVSLIEQMAARGVDIIVIAPADSRALIPSIKRAMENGVIVINIDNKLDSDLLAEANLVVPFVGPDNREGAKLAGDYLAEKLQRGDEVAIIGGISTAFNAVQRQRGFEDSMSAVGAKVVSIQAGNWEQAKASTVAAAMISENPNLKAILCSNDNMAIGAIAAVRQSGKTSDIHIIGFDNISATHELLRNGELLATVDQYGGRLAINGIEYALQILQGGVVPEDRNTMVTLVTATDL